MTSLNDQDKFQSPFVTYNSVVTGATADNELTRSMTILRNEGINPIVAIEIASESDGVLCGITEIQTWLRDWLFSLPKNTRGLWSVQEGSNIEKGEVVVRIVGPYASFGLYETAILGALSSSSGWATASKECVKAAKDIPVVCMGARNIHPQVVGIMDYSARIGGCAATSTAVGSDLHGGTPSGTMPHSMILLFGDTLRAVLAFDKHMAADVPRVALVDTFRDEAQESVEIARSLKRKLRGIRLDTPKERGGVTPSMVFEIQSRLKNEGFDNVDIYVSGGLNPERIAKFVESKAPVIGFGVGNFIASASPLSFTADIKAIQSDKLKSDFGSVDDVDQIIENFIPISKRGRIPGLTNNNKLTRLF
ncbi:MAG: nicotinate phosphoribosyltransferase [Dehalococcoidia bacterium]